jgi:hypothetical protein
MRESEIRQRIETVLRRRLQAMLAPALSLGMAAASCGGGGSEYGAQIPRGVDADDGIFDVASDIPPGEPTYGAAFPRDGATVDAPMSVNGMLDTAVVVDAPVDVSIDAAQEDVPLKSDLPRDSAGESATGLEASSLVDAGNGADT